jgi:multiple sugar transport system permease protein
MARAPRPPGPPTDLSAAALMTAPAAAGLLIFVAVPFLLAVGLSFTNLRLGSPLPLEWVGLEQYRRIFEDAGFRRAVFNNAYFAAVIVPVQTGLALGAAVLVNRRFPGRTWVRAAFFVPVVFPMAMVAVAWELLYAPGPGGALNSWLDAVTFGLWQPRDFLRDPALAMPSLMALSVWQGMGLQMVILLAGLQAIPQSLYESARLDGAGPWARFRHVTVPQLRNPLVFVVVVTTILAFRVFDQVEILTRGGPRDATTTVMYEAVTAAFTRQQVALASAMSVVFFVSVLAVTWLGRQAFRQAGERP